MSWDESRPERGDLIRDVGPVIRSHKTEFRAGVEKHFFWTQSSGLSAGEPSHATLSDATGSCRAFYGPESAVSAYRDGCLMMTSDTSRLYGLTSNGSFLLGSMRAVRMPSIAANVYQLVQSDQSTLGHGTGNFNITFPTVYNGVPTHVSVVPHYSDTDATAQTQDAVVVISSITEGGVVCDLAVRSANVEIWWRSVGTVTIT